LFFFVFFVKFPLKVDLFSNYDDDFEDEPILFNNNNNNNNSPLSNKNYQHQIDSLGLMTSNSNIANLANNNSSDLVSSSNLLLNNNNNNNNSNQNNNNNRNKSPSSFVANRSNYDER
jgi:hypothetical protein